MLLSLSLLACGTGASFHPAPVPPIQGQVSPAAVLAAAPAAVSALPSAIAAADAPRRTGDSASLADSPAEGLVAALSASFDGAVSREAAVDTEPRLPDYLTVADASDRSLVAAAVRAAGASPMARRVLRSVSRLAEERGRPMPVFIGGRIGGEFDYDTDVVGIGRRYRGRSPELVATVLVHELQHVLQKAKILPGDAFELELEAYLVDFQVYRELDISPPPGSWDARAQARFRKGLEPFVKWLLDEYKDNIPLIGSSIAAYDAALAARQKQAERAISRRAKTAARTKAVLADMERTGQPAWAIINYREGVVTPALAKLRDARIALAWARRDRELLRRPADRRRFQDFARRVYARAEALQRERNLKKTAK